MVNRHNFVFFVPPDFRTSAPRCFNPSFTVSRTVNPVTTFFPRNFLPVATLPIGGLDPVTTLLPGTHLGTLDPVATMFSGFYPGALDPVATALHRTHPRSHDPVATVLSGTHSVDVLNSILVFTLHVSPSPMLACRANNDSLSPT
eukprot:CAMPEP_0184296928 /NCGR_PEP_ID=MMETSP1049-20130417/7874_1 /TAXON_ID=77928 /ORGANISM="Proteomonas sulcata, Strain CCMP704" /LENGTH=144 /DNA_ID=CAMNT_0026606405 /DNA_START=61 /DNA_END=492 /DNA_ORIENTATION=-